jgi:hypothetical protein
LTDTTRPAVTGSPRGSEQRVSCGLARRGVGEGREQHRGHGHDDDHDHDGGEEPVSLHDDQDRHGEHDGSPVEDDEPESEPPEALVDVLAAAGFAEESLDDEPDLLSVR